MTQVVHVPLEDRAYDIHIGRGLMGQAGALIEPVLQRTKVAIVTDSNVAPLHLHRLKEALQTAGIAHAHCSYPKAGPRDGRAETAPTPNGPISLGAGHGRSSSTDRVSGPWKSTSDSLKKLCSTSTKC